MDKIKYQEHKRTALGRGIVFKLTFQEWMSIWTTSGHFHERGCRKGQYVMARKNDCGPYAIGNVRIITVTENHREVSSKVRSRNAKGNKGFLGRKHTNATKEKMRHARLNRIRGISP